MKFVGGKIVSDDAGSEDDPLRAELHQAVAAVIAAVQAIEKRILERNRESRVECDRVLGDAQTKANEVIRKVEVFDSAAAKIAQNMLDKMLRG
jgi:hypothetical protein